MNKTSFSHTQKKYSKKQSYQNNQDASEPAYITLRRAKNRRFAILFLSLLYTTLFLSIMYFIYSGTAFLALSISFCSLTLLVSFAFLVASRKRLKRAPKKTKNKVKTRKNSPLLKKSNRRVTSLKDITDSIKNTNYTTEEIDPYANLAKKMKHLENSTSQNISTTPPSKTAKQVDEFYDWGARETTATENKKNLLFFEKYQGEAQKTDTSPKTGSVSSLDNSLKENVDIDNTELHEDYVGDTKNSLGSNVDEILQNRRMTA